MHHIIYFILETQLLFLNARPVMLFLTLACLTASKSVMFPSEMFPLYYLKNQRRRRRRRRRKDRRRGEKKRKEVGFMQLKED